MLLKGKISLIETIVGIFLTLSAVTLVTTVVFKSRELGWFEEEQYYSIRIPSSKGIKENTSVLMKGIPVGYVTDIAIADDNTVIVTMLIQEKYAKRVTPGTLVEVMLPPLGFGDASIHIIPGGRGNPLESLTELEVIAAPEGIQKKAENLAGTAQTALTSGDRLFNTINALMEEWLIIFKAFNKGEGIVFEAIADVRGAIADLRSTNQELKGSLKRLDQGLDNVNRFSGDIADISGEFRKGEGGLARLLDSTVKLTTDLEPAGKNISDITSEVLSLVGKTSSAIDDLSAQRETLSDITASLRGTMSNVESITGKIDKGEGALGQFINDDDIYSTIEEAVDTTAGLIKSLNQVKTWVRLQEEFSAGLDVNAVSVGMRIEPRPSRYFYVGGVFLDPASTSKVVSDEEDMILFPEALVAQRIWDNKITFKVGLIEGKIGGGIDWDVFDFIDETSGLSESKLTLGLEGRDKYDSGDVGYNENVDEPILRTRIEYKFKKYFFVRVGVDNILNDADYCAGIGFEYVDQDVTTVVGLMNI